MSKIIPKQEAEEARVDKIVREPSVYEVATDATFTIKFSTKQHEGRWIICEPDELDSSVENHWVEFKVWNFADEIAIRKESTGYDAYKRMHIVDHDRMNRIKVQKLIKAWSFEEKDDRLKLIHVNGVLCDESYNVFMRLHPNIVRTIIEKMNEVLEYNG
jgi:hypothetical protein